MYLKKLDVFGFKSFADKTTLHFEQGIAAIVGPNGCGKSNVFDAVRWVLGEQSAKDLRGSSMEDVIFNGTEKRPPLGFAEVSLTFANETRVLPIEHDEVVITRRLFRSKESEYLINKNTCRLKDVVELFLGTGVGAEAYSLIQQGRVDLVVSAKPEDRRQIFDEAAGITKYKAKKKEALSKLKETEDNLLRLNDIVVEVKRQIATIERQAKKAQRYKEDFEQLKQYEIVAARHQMAQFTDEQAEVTGALSGFQDKESRARVQLEEINLRLEHETALLEEAEEGLNALKARQMQLDNEIELNIRQISFNEERLSGIETSRERLGEDKTNALARCAEAQARIEEINLGLNQLRAESDQAHSRLQAKKSLLSVLLASIQEAQNTIKSFDQEIFSLNAQDVRLKNLMTENMKQVMEALARKSRLEHESAKVNTEQQQVEERIEGIHAAIAQVQGSLGQLWTAHHERRGRFDASRAALLSQEQSIIDLEKAKIFLTSQKDFIQKMHLQYQDNPDPVVEGKFIAAVRPNDQQTGIIGKIKSIDVIPAYGDVPERYEITVETKYIALDLQYMDERITALDAQLAKGQQAKEQLSEQVRQEEVLIEADLKEIRDQEKKLSVLEFQRTDGETECGKLVGESDMITMEFSQIESFLAELKVKERELSAHAQGVSMAITRCQDDTTAKQRVIAAKSGEREELNVSLAQMEAEYAALADKENGLQEQGKVHTASLDRDLADISRFEEEMRDLQVKAVKINEEITALNGTIEQGKSRKEAMAGELNQRAQAKTEMSQRLNSLRHQATAIEEEIIASKNELHQLQMKEQELHFGMRALKERLLQAYKIDWDALEQQEMLSPTVLDMSSPNAFRQGRISIGLIVGDLKHADVGFPAEASGNDSEQLPVEQTAQAPQPQLNLEELTLEVDRLKKRCESYGAVNLVAIEEFEDFKTRYEFLTRQQSDLLTAREGLMSTIQKINRTTRQMFTDTFTRVNEEFRVYFRMLFGGGEAQLVLLDPENALECGIDIMARPPGKKLQSISLLSGGEKTLTAIALIFGVFKVNPSPFCVLDEIDAALDESNVDRFAVLLKEFAKIAQFVVITHNKKTMIVADVMYGVTMQERGVSRIVSVKFNEYKPQAPVLSLPQAVQQPQPALAEV